MKLHKPPQTLPDGKIEAAHEVEAVCLHCGYDLDCPEDASYTGSDCGKALELKQNVAIQVTTLPPILGGVM